MAPETARHVEQFRAGLAARQPGRGQRLGLRLGVARVAGVRAGRSR